MKEKIELPKELGTRDLCDGDKFCTLGFLSYKFGKVSIDELVEFKGSYNTLYAKILPMLDIDEKYLKPIWYFNDFSLDQLTTESFIKAFKDILDDMNLNVFKLSEDRRERIITYLNSIPNIKYEFV